MNRNLVISKLQLLSDEITILQNQIYDDVIAKIERSWRSDEAIIYIHRVEEVIDELKAINSFIDDFKGIIGK